MSPRPWYLEAPAWCLHPLMGDDRRLSWSKLVLAAVLALYAAGVALPVTVAVVAILASYGAKVLLKGLALIQVKLSAADAVRQLRARVDVAMASREPSLDDDHQED
jgi:hypothetical protein